MLANGTLDPDFRDEAGTTYALLGPDANATWGRQFVKLASGRYLFLGTYEPAATTPGGYLLAMIFGDDGN